MTICRFGAEGELIPLTAEELAGADDESSVLCYTTGVLEDNRPYYAYVAVTPSRYSEFMAVTTSKQAIVLGDYGTVIAGGFEADAPTGVKQKMHETYGFDDSYQARMIRRVHDEHRAFIEARDTKRIMDAVAYLKSAGGDENPTR